MLISNCCGASNRNNGDVDFSEFGICPECGEHCEFIDDDEGADDGSLDTEPENNLHPIFSNLLKNFI